MERHLDGTPEHANGLAFAAACYAAADRMEDARAAVARLTDLSPEFTISYTLAAAPYARAEDLELYCAMLARAGLSA